jgi:hypothetical protein
VVGLVVAWCCLNALTVGSSPVSLTIKAAAAASRGGPLLLAVAQREPCGR